MTNDRDQLAALIRPHLGGAPGTLSGQWADRVAQEIAADVEARGWRAPLPSAAAGKMVRVTLPDGSTIQLPAPEDACLATLTNGPDGQILIHYTYADGAGRMVVDTSALDH